MRKYFITITSFLLFLCLMLSGCGNETASPSTTASSTTSSSISSSDSEEVESADSSSEEIPVSDIDELTVHFGDEGEPFTMHLEDNETAAAITGYVGTSDWRLPIYNYDESDVMEYYDIPSRYEIPAEPENVTEAAAGDVYYSEPNRIVLYYQDAEISEEYVKIGTFDADDAFVSAVEDNPVLEGWGNKIVLITAGE
ncbi:MAG: cyclophilin-like fold protein [Lachnospiraceae bacterium]|nr:cyclophilin-like fold protein [Lachnospiraceae bacterium]